MFSGECTNVQDYSALEAAVLHLHPADEPTKTLAQ